MKTVEILLLYEYIVTILIFIIIWLLKSCKISLEVHNIERGNAFNVHHSKMSNTLFVVVCNQFLEHNSKKNWLN